MPVASCPGLEFRLLGPFELVADQRVIEIGSPKQRLLLAMLVVERNHAVPMDVLAEELWGAHPPANVAMGLQSLVSRLRRVLATSGEADVSLQGRGDAYVLEVAPSRVDAERFCELASRGRALAASGVFDDAARAFRSALALWRGPALVDFADRQFASVEAARLDEARGEITEALADAELALGRPAEAVAVLEPHLATQPFREGAWGRLMVALYRAGRQAEALRAYQRVRALLTEELGLEPNPALRQLEQLILSQSPELDGPGAVGPVSAGASESRPFPPPGPGDTRAFLFTDIEGSTRRWEGDQDAMAVDLARHDAVLRLAVETNSGRIMSHTGDGVCADFPTASAALTAAVEGERALLAEQWRAKAPLRVRMAVHAGAAEAREGTYFGPTLNRTARLLGLAAGGQILCSAAAADLAEDRLPAGVALIDLGEHRLPDLARPERVFQVVHPELPADLARPTRADADRNNNLPTALSRFLGRTADLAELERLLAGEEPRLLTLWGPGGAGKTRLAVELGSRTLRSFPDGVWFVELAPHDDPGQVVPAVLSTLGVVSGVLGPGAVDGTGQLCEYLKPRRLLLVLDNCEHLLEAAAGLARAVLIQCPAVRVLATSREPLGVSGECAWEVPPLSLPPPDDDDLSTVERSDAVALFCDRARTAKAGFALTDANATAVARICRRLDGIPLALELAAARIRVLGAKRMAERLDDALGLLTGGPRTSEARHQTLRATMDWSYALLSPPEQELLNRLAVFPGSFDLEAAEAVAAGPPGEERPAGFEVLDLLARLVDKSLVVTGDDDGEIRYRLLETVRQYAAEKLQASGQSELTRRRHRDHFLRWADGFERTHYLDDTELVRAHRDWDNLRTALEWSLSVGEAEPAIRLAAGLWMYWWWTDHPGGRTWLERSLSLPGRPRIPATAEVLAGLAHYALSPTLMQEALDLADALGDDEATARLRLFAGNVGDVLSGVAGGEHIVEAALGGFQAAGSTIGTGWCHHELAWLALASQDCLKARSHLEAALELGPPANLGPVLTAHLLGALAFVAAILGDADRAATVADQAVESARDLPLQGVLIMALTRAVEAAVLSERWFRAEAILRELLSLLHRLGARRWVAEALELTGIVLEATNRHTSASQALRAAARHRAELGEPPAGGLPALASALRNCQARLSSAGSEPMEAARPSLSDPVDVILRWCLSVLDGEPSDDVNWRVPASETAQDLRREDRPQRDT